MAASKPDDRAAPVVSGPKVYGVAKNLTHDHQEYAPGDAVELTAKQAKDLIASGVVVDPDAKKEEQVDA